MIVLEQNRQKFEMCRIPEWHRAGYKGEGVKICIMEEGTHGQQVENILWQVAPKAEIEWRRRPGARVSQGSFCPDTKKNFEEFYRELRDDGFNIITHSLGGHATPEKELLLEELILGKDMIFTTSAGNTGNDIISRRASYMGATFAVGACDISPIREPGNLRNIIGWELERKEYSSTGEKVDVYGFAGLYNTRGFEKENVTAGGYFRGTSCANPFFTGILAIWLGWRFKKGLGSPDYKAINWFVNINGERVDEYGKLARLPSAKEAEFSPLQGRLAQDKLEGKSRSKRQILRQWGMSEEEASVSAVLYEGWFK